MLHVVTIKKPLPSSEFQANGKHFYSRHILKSGFFVLAALQIAALLIYSSCNDWSVNFTFICF